MAEKIKVLFVEDEIDVRESIAGVLEAEGFEVIQAINGKEGLEIFLAQEPDVIISDIMMPEMNGYDLLKAVRESKTNSTTPFILLSALGQKEDVLKGVTLDASDYLVKPVDFDLLFAKIREKTSNAKRQQTAINQNIDNLKSQVSNIVPQEMLQYVDLINQISGLLKTEIYGPLPHQKYLDDINKIYLHSLKLKTIVGNLFNGSAMSNQLDISDEVMSPFDMLQSFVSGINKKFQPQIEIEKNNEESVSNIKINKKIVNEILKKLIGCMFKINEQMNIRIVTAEDHLGRLIFIFYSSIKIDKKSLESQISKSVIDNSLDSQGLTLEVVDNNSITGAVLIVPNYRVVKKSGN